MSNSITVSLHQAAHKELDYQNKIKSGEIVPSTSGFKFIDSKLLGGANDTDVIMIAALTGVGKSTLALQIGYNICTLNKQNRVLYFSFEMQDRKLAAKLIAGKIQKSLKEMYDKDGSQVDAEHFDTFKDVPFDIIDFPMNADLIENVCNKYCIKYPDWRCHFIFDHSMIVKNRSGDNSMETLEAIGNLCNNTKKINSRVYWIVSQLNDNIQDYKRLEKPSGQIPRLEDIYGSKTLPHACNNIVVLCRPSQMNLPKGGFGPKGYPLKQKNSNREYIYAVTVKARDGGLGIDVLLDNLQYSQLIEPSEKFLQKFYETYDKKENSNLEL